MTGKLQCKYYTFSFHISIKLAVINFFQIWTKTLTPNLWCRQLLLSPKLLPDLRTWVQNTVFWQKNRIQSEQYNTTTNFSIQYVCPPTSPPHATVSARGPYLRYFTQFCSCLTAVTFHQTCVSTNKRNIYFYIFKHPVELAPDGVCVKIVMSKSSAYYTHMCLALTL
jgi:hypothetical protein